MFVIAQSIKINENNISFDMAGIFNLQMLRVGKHLAVNLCFYCF